MENIIIIAVSGGWYGFIGADGDRSQSPALQKKYILECLKTKALHTTILEGGVIDPGFWNALCKICDWKGEYMPFALQFHKINLSEGWQKAIRWLYNVVVVTALPEGPKKLKEKQALISNN